ncbi:MULTISPECIES: hypothetical protein [Vibrio]|uniref:Uncharacterized protein n=3 Tax=Vibrio TaxID=662 RepID=A0ACD5FZA8_9VIBR|nr:MULTISPECIES: hypothetical protein [Vibrio]MCF7497076.1 porin family protein [Vibrio sp. L5-1]PMK78415.1 hypothetical protein BCT92_20455 [Vibrio sp. 10N.261.52.E5]TKF79305.1 hypothetical protein FCV65_22155 [Vibrio sp. F13]
MRKYNRAVFLMFSILVTSKVFSQEDNVTVNDNIKFGIGYAGSLIESGEGYDEYHGYEVSFGYIYQDRFLVETGLSKLNSSNEFNPDNYFLRSSRVFPLSDYASYYVGAGVNYLNKEIYPGINVGIHFEFHKDWYVDAGYQTLISDINDNIYSLLLSINYKFEINPIQVDNVKDDFIVLSRPTTSIKNFDGDKRVKNTYYKKYSVIKGDNLTFISRKLGVPLHELILSNPQLALKRNSIDLIYPSEIIYYPSRR